MCGDDGADDSGDQAWPRGDEGADEAVVALAVGGVLTSENGDGELCSVVVVVVVDVPTNVAVAGRMVGMASRAERFDAASVGPARRRSDRHSSVAEKSSMWTSASVVLVCASTLPLS
jgi:hypothetical protein